MKAEGQRSKVEGRVLPGNSTPAPKCLCIRNSGQDSYARNPVCFGYVAAAAIFCEKSKRKVFSSKQLGILSVIR